MEVKETESVSGQEIKCHDCGGLLHFKPGTHHLACEYCGAYNEISSEAAQTEELDYHAFLQESAIADEVETAEVSCETCGATTGLQENITSDVCPFCSGALILKNGSTRKLRPKYLLPFKIDQQAAFAGFKSWIKKLWWAPNDLKKFAKHPEKLKGVYIPYWTYDSATSSDYSGARGDYYYVTETYTTTENGKSVTRTRQVRRTRWTSVSGHVDRQFDDVLVLASNSLPREKTEKLEPWDLHDLKDFDERFLSGFKTEQYQLDLGQGFDRAKEIMEDKIRDDVRADIGGDEQRIHRLHTSYDQLTFKHILLPVWISAYQYKKKVYRFLINGRTGEVQGERPYSFWKIFFAVLGVLALGAGIWWWVEMGPAF